VASLEGGATGRAAHQGPDVDGTTTLPGLGAPVIAVGDIVRAEVVATDGVDLVAKVV
jgi:ribosomal protein S12 methylthiotransferase